jgi:hypothetical protein
MMLRTYTSLHRMGDDLETEVHLNLADTLDAARSSLERGLPGGELAAGRVAQLDVERHLVTVDPQVSQLLARDEILAGQGVDDGTQRVKQRDLGNGHGVKDCGAG